MTYFTLSLIDKPGHSILDVDESFCDMGQHNILLYVQFYAVFA